MLRAALFCLVVSLSALLPLQAQDAASPAAQYIELSPSFVGTVGPGPRIQYMKIDVALRANDPAAVAKIQYHDPLIRNALVRLFGQQTLEGLASLEGKERLRTEALEVVRNTLEEEEGEPLVDDLLFTNLVTQ
ncbi:MAG: flagellar basal body-associated FliL family protein [Pseudomonas sp.]